MYPGSKSSLNEKGRVAGSPLNAVTLLLSAVVVVALLLLSVKNLFLDVKSVPLPAWERSSLLTESPFNSNHPNPLRNQIALYARLKRAGFLPKVALNIGLEGNAWGELVQSLFSNVRVYVVAVAVSSDKYRFPYIQGDLAYIKPSYSSFNRNQTVPRTAGSAVQSYSIDEVVQSIEQPDVVRIRLAKDALAILRAASNVLSNAELVILETNFLDGHANDFAKPLALLGYLHSLGFQLLDIGEFLKFAVETYTPAIEPVTFALVRKDSIIWKKVHELVGLSLK